MLEQIEPTPIHGFCYRVVESQEQIATNSFVDTVEEQALLESLLETTKPPLPPGVEGLHYLLSTPFRYPPLRWGSRFGTRFEPSIFYAGTTPYSALCESAYYRFVYILSMEEPPAHIDSQHTLFSCRYYTKLGIRLQDLKSAQKELRNPVSYTYTHEVGRTMRDQGIEGFEYASARGEGQCVGLFKPKALESKSPESSERLICKTTPTQVSYRNLDTGEITHFTLDQFMIAHTFPFPPV